MYSVHRLEFEIFHGPIPKNKEVHHTCSVRNCCKPAHLELVNHQMNVDLTPGKIALRYQRLQDLFVVNFELHFLDKARMTSTDLSLVWGKNFKGSNLLNYLKTLALVFEDDFEWSLVDKGKGRRPHLFQIKISDRFREWLDDAERDASLILVNSLTDLVTLPAEF